MPPLLLGLAFLAQPIRQKLFPVPIPVPAPTPKPPPVPSLWTTRFYSDTGSIPRILPSPDSKTVYMAGEINNHASVISAWDVNSGHLLRSFPGAIKPRSSLSRVFQWSGFALSDDGKRLSYTWVGTGSLHRTGIYDTKSGARLRFISKKTEHGHVTCQPRSHNLAIGLDGRFEIWNADSAALLQHVVWRDKNSPFNWLKSPVYSPDAQRLAIIRTQDTEMGNYSYANGKRDKIGIFSTRNWRRTHTFSWPNTEVRAIGFINNGQTLIVNCTRGLWAKSKTGNNSIYPLSSVRLLDWKSGRERVLRQLPVWRSYKQDLAISPDGRFFAIADAFPVYRSVGHRMVTAEKETSYIEIREAQDGKKIASLRLPNISSVRSMAFAPDNSVLYYVEGYGNYIKQWPKTQWQIAHSPNSNRIPNKALE